MILTDYFYYPHNLTWDYAVQCGVNHGVIRAPETEDFDLCNAGHWQQVCDDFRNHGIQPLVLEPLPNKLHDHIKAGDEKRDESIDSFIRMLPIIKSQGIDTVCFNFMAHVGWTRTSRDYPERGGALVTGFDLKDFVPVQASITQEQLWENYAYFIRAVVPEAERCGVKLALHPDDPPMAKLGDVGRIMISYENIHKAIHMVESPMLGVTYCQATYHMMGEDVVETAKKFGDKIFFVHFRNTLGNLDAYRETFHDNGAIDMAKIMKLYHDCGIDVPVRVDHVPTMVGENMVNQGYDAIGRYFAIGYLKGILQAVEML